MINIVYIIKILLLTSILSIQIISQNVDKRFTHNSENGFMWLDFEKRMIAKDMKYDFLSVMLDNQKLKKLSGNYENDLGCDTEINKLQLEDNIKLDLHLMVKMVDNFYTSKTNLIIPINLAYCYCIKELAGFQSEKLDVYRKKVIDFSLSKSE
jgi:hypothetical protein